MSSLQALENRVAELILKTSTSKKVDWASYADNPVGFMVDVLGDKPWARQQEIALAVRDDALVSVASANGIGKDWLAARLSLWLAYCRNARVVLSGPSQRQVENILFRKELRDATDRLPGTLYNTRFETDGRGSIMGATSNEVSKLTGIHDPSLLFIITEAQGVDDMAIEAALSCAVGESNKVLLLANPLKAEGAFYRAHTSSHWTTFTITAFEHPNVVEGREVIPGAVTREGIARIKAEYGEESNIYKSRVLAQFPTSSSAAALIEREWLEAAADRTPRKMAADFVVGLDVSRFGADKTVMAIKRGDQLRHLIEWSKTDTVGSARRCVMELANMGIGHASPAHGFKMFLNENFKILVDAIGIGAGVVDQLRSWDYAAQEFNSSERAFNKKFANKRAEAYWHLRTLLERGRIVLPKHERLWKELLAHSYGLDGNGRLIIESKELIRKRLGHSPDYSDAVAICFSGGSGITGMADLVNL